MWFAYAFRQVNFGNPFILQIGGEETLAEIKPRIQVIAVCVAGVCCLECTVCPSEFALLSFCILVRAS